MSGIVSKAASMMLKCRALRRTAQKMLANFRHHWADLYAEAAKY